MVKVANEVLDVWEGLLREEMHAKDPDVMYFRWLCDCHQLDAIFGQKDISKVESFLFEIEEASREGAVVKVLRSPADDADTSLSLREVADRMCKFFNGKTLWASLGEETMQDSFGVAEDIGDYCKEVGVEYVRFEVYAKSEVVSEDEKSVTVKIHFEPKNFVIE